MEDENVSMRMTQITIKKTFSWRVTKKEVKKKIEVIKVHSDEELYCDIDQPMLWVDYYLLFFYVVFFLSLSIL